MNPDHLFYLTLGIIIGIILNRPTLTHQNSRATLTR